MRKLILLSCLLSSMAAAACGHPSKPPQPIAEPQAPPPPPAAASEAATPPPASGDAALVAEAKQFVGELDPQIRKLTVAASEAQWANETDLTPEHEALTAKANEINLQ